MPGNVDIPTIVHSCTHRAVPIGSAKQRAKNQAGPIMFELNNGCVACALSIALESAFGRGEIRRIRASNHIDVVIFVQGQSAPRGFVARAADLEVGDSVPFELPSGERVAVTRIGDGDQAEDFIALSSICPHLGCQVHWQALESRFFCPCHNGVFDPSGKGIGGPPGEAGQSLAQYPLKVEGGLLHIAVPTTRLADGTEPQGQILASSRNPAGPGHDPCLGPLRGRDSCPPARKPRRV